MKRDWLSFATRLSAWFTLVVIGLSVALFFAAYFLLYRAVREQDREVVRAQFEVYRAWYSEGGLSTLRTRFLANDDGGKGVFFVRVVGPRDSILFFHLPKQSAGLDLGPLKSLTHGKAIEWLTLPARDRGADLLVATGQLSDGTWLQVGKTTEALLAKFRTIFGRVAAVALLLGIAGGAWLTRRALAPIRQLAGAVESVIATGRIDERMPVPEANDEISHLAQLFNTMLEKNESLIRGMREALDNVAHDLRTPLTRLRGTAELALADESNPQKARDALLDTMEESDRVLTMLNTLMDISEAETGLMKLDIQPVPLAELVSDVVELFEFVAEEKHITVASTIAPELRCSADRNRLQQILVNLLDNALKYTPDNGRVAITADARAGETCITVEDTGQGISADEIPRIWERLYRGDKSRSQRGLGLGLSLVRAIVSAHGGRIELQSTVGKGSIFSILLPVK